MNISGPTNYFIPKKLHNSGRGSSYAKIIVHSGFIALIATPIFSYTYYTLDDLADARILLICGSILALGPFILKVTKNLDFTKELSIFVFFSMLILITENQGGFFSPSIFWLLLVPILGVYLGSKHSGIYWLILTIFTIISFYFLHQIKVIGYVNFVSDMHFIHAQSVIGLILISYAFIYIFKKDEAIRIASLQDSLLKRKRVSKKLLNLAQYDTLTKLPNRSYCSALLNRTIINAKKQRNSFAVFYVDLDNFKNINNTLGHDIGDHLLIDTAKRFQNCLNKDDLVCRLGGDEFVFIIKNINRFIDAENIAKRIINKLAQPYLINNYSIATSPSIGIAVFPDHSTDKTALIKSAEIAMYHAKNLGKNNYKFYTQDIDNKIQRLALMEEYLPFSIKCNELSIAYQPQFDPNTFEVVGIEALLRWKNSKLGTVTPDEFIPVAEQIGAIKIIGEWVLKQSCLDFLEWQKLNIVSKKTKLAINLSIIQVMQKDFMLSLTKIIQNLKVDTNQIELELTESIIMSDTTKTIETLEELTKLGISVAIDDFGIGNSSLNRVATIPADTLKIDKSFVNDIPKNPKSVATIKSVISLAHGLNFKIVAEGVETHEQFEFLKEHGVYAIQGFYISAPIDKEQMISLLKSQAKLRS